MATTVTTAGGAAGQGTDRRGLRQIAPGVWVDPAQAKVPVEREYLLMDERGYDQLGLKPEQQKTLSRLFQCGKITLYYISPKVWLMDLHSWRAHLKRVAEDPWYWEDAKNLNEYRGTYDR